MAVVAPPTLLGVPFDAASSFRRGSAAGPAAIRAALASPAGNSWTEGLVDLGVAGTLVDAGDVVLSDVASARTSIEAGVAAVLVAGGRPIVLGGDHSITYPVLRAVRRSHSHLSVLHIDAHPDLYDEFQGDRYSHACPFSRTLEEGLADELVQVGIRTMNAPQRAQAERFGVDVIDMDAWVAGRRPSLAYPVYMSIDLDGLDLAHVPGVSHPEPGGLTVREVVTMIHGLEVPLVGADVVELNPDLDQRGLTALVASKLVKELAGRMLCVALLVGAALLGCAHEAPFPTQSYQPGVPRDTGALVQLTYNPGVDLAPVWLPDGRGFLYSEERVDRFDRDRCLALLPRSGGQIEQEICDRTPAADDSVNAFTSPAVSASGRLAYVRASAPLDVGRPIAPRYHEVVLATLAHPSEASVLLTLPYVSPGGQSHDEVTYLQWLGDHSLIYVAQRVVYAPPCRGCAPDTLRTGVDIVRLDFDASTSTLTVLRGGDQASSATIVAPDTIYFTANGDSRVFSLALSTDSIGVVHDFGASGIARDAQVAGHRLVAVVGGNVAFTSDSALGAIQRDSGGALMVVNLNDGTETTLTPPGMPFRHPALAPTADFVVAEAVIARSTDLWLVRVP